MTPGCDSQRGQRLTGIGRHNCGARLLIHEIPFKRRFLGVFGCQKWGGEFSEVSTYGDTEGGSGALGIISGTDRTPGIGTRQGQRPLDRAEVSRLRPAHPDDVGAFVARALGADPGGRADHEADGLPGLGRPAAERRHLDVSADVARGYPLALLAGPEPLVGRRVPSAVHLGEHPGVPLDGRRSRDDHADPGRHLAPGATHLPGAAPVTADIA